MSMGVEGGGAQWSLVENDWSNWGHPWAAKEYKLTAQGKAGLSQNDVYLTMQWVALRDSKWSITGGL